MCLVGLTFLQVILYMQKQFSLFRAALTQATGMNLGQELEKSLCSHCYWWKETVQLVRKDIEKVKKSETVKCKNKYLIGKMK
jgi:hypothetical protein